MTDTECVAFLQWALPRVQMRWTGFRRVRRQVCRRLRKRASALGLSDLSSYRRYLERTPREWCHVDTACRVTISRFFRDHRVFERLLDVVLPCLAGRAEDDGARCLRCLSLGCASGEEPYTLAILWHLTLACRYPRLGFQIDAIDVDDRLLARAERGCYGPATLRELPVPWRLAGFEPHGSQWCVKRALRHYIRFQKGDVRGGLPEHRYHLVLCRNLVFTYYETTLQRRVLTRIAARLRPGGALVVGAHESLPDNPTEFEPWSDVPSAYRRLETDPG